MAKIKGRDMVLSSLYPWSTQGTELGIWSQYTL